MTHQPDIVERQKDHCKILTRVQAMTTITGPGVEGELADIRMQIYTHTVTRKDTTCSNGSAEHTKSQTYNSTLTDSSQGSCVQSSRPSSIPESSAALRPASEVVEMVYLSYRTDIEPRTNAIIARDRREVVRAFVEWYNAMPGAQIGEWTVDIFIRTHLGGEQC